MSVRVGRSREEAWIETNKSLVRTWIETVYTEKSIQKCRHNGVL
nr:MAG TPA: hypothetical protein [Caudoviricetes sp.]